MKPLIVANWKCNPTTIKEAKKLFNLVKKGLGKIKKTEVVICPPFLYILNLKSKILNLKLGGQDCFFEQKGAFTGEISPVMLKDAGCQYIIVGHSERRRYFGETDGMISKKLRAVLKIGLKPILCVGETEKERNEGKTEKVLEKQLQEDLKSILNLKSLILNLIVAYEPVWAIGTGNPCDVEEAQKMGLVIRKIVSEIYNQKIAKNLPILYGGSVNSKNSAGYIKEAGFQGLLVGGASLEAKEFVKIVKSSI